MPVVLDWHAQLPRDKKHLLIGIKLGHETSIGVNAYHYPGGNELLAKPAAEDPVGRLKTLTMFWRAAWRRSAMRR